MAGSLTERRSSELTDRDWYIQETFGFDRCEACNAVPIEVRVTVLVPTSIVAAKHPERVAAGAYGAPVRTRSGELYFTVAKHRACTACRRALIQMMQARYPDSAAVIVEEPPSDRIVVAVG